MRNHRRKRTVAFIPKRMSFLLAEPVFHALAWPTTLLSESRCSPALVLPKEGLMYDPSCRKAMEKAFLILPNGETIFLKQERGCVCQITACQCAVHPGNSHPSLIIFGGKTVKKRVNEILEEHGEHMILITLRINRQSMIIRKEKKIQPKTDQKNQQNKNPKQKPLTNSRAFHRLEGYGLQSGPKKGN